MLVVVVVARVAAGCLAAAEADVDAVLEFCESWHLKRKHLAAASRLVTAVSEFKSKLSHCFHRMLK